MPSTCRVRDFRQRGPGSRWRHEAFEGKDRDPGRLQSGGKLQEFGTEAQVAAGVAAEAVAQAVRWGFGDVGALGLQMPMEQRGQGTEEAVGCSQRR